MDFRSVSERGQALVIIALAIIGLVGITGLAIDGSAILADRRHAQNAADTSALAGALAKIKPQTDSDGNVIPWNLVALDRASANGYTGDLVHSEVEVYTCDDADASCSAPYAGDSNYVQVIITSNVDTFFARVLGIPQLHNRVQAVALAHQDGSGSLLGGAGVYALNPNCPSNGSLIITGNADITLTGSGMLSNSDDSCAVKCSTSAGSLTICNEFDGSGNCIDEGTITTAGGDFTWGGNCQDTMVGSTSDGGAQLKYPDDVPVIPEPPECDSADTTNWPTQQIKDFYDPVNKVTVQASYITPGYYVGFPPKKVNGVAVKNTIVMAPGVYCVDSVLKQSSDGIHLFGDDVTIYVLPGNDVTINGGVVQLRATNGDGALYKPHDTTNEAYMNYLFVIAPDYDGAVTACKFEGNANNIYQGAIFAPHCDVTINGTADTPPDGINSQIIGYNVTINGGADLTINYDASLNPYITDYPKTGIAR
jgi:Putative Flp pilus-assembly TadE/G-like